MQRSDAIKSFTFCVNVSDGQYNCYLDQIAVNCLLEMECLQEDNDVIAL